jgi:hypothetical protein
MTAEWLCFVPAFSNFFRICVRKTTSLSREKRESAIAILLLFDYYEQVTLLK